MGIEKRKVFFVKRFFATLCIATFFVTGASFAQDDEDEKKGILETVIEELTKPIDKVISPILELGQIVVTPTKTKEKLGSQSSSVSVLTEKDFERGKYYTVKNALKDEESIDIVESGAFTGQTSIFMRGTNSNQTVFMVDGVKVYDPISPNGAFNLAHLTLDNVERIEIVRGAQSTLYGSDAIGGVINVITKKAEEPFFNASFETGAFSTFKETFQVGSANHGFHYSIGGSNVKSRGISNAQAKNNNPELDGYDRLALSGRLDYDVFENLTIGTTARYTQTLFDYDQFGRDDPNIHQKNYQSIFTQYIDHKPFDFYSYYIKLGWMYMYRKDNDANNGNTIDYLRDWYTGYEFIFDYRNNFHILDIDTLTIGYEFIKEMGDSYYFLAWGRGAAQNSTSDMPKCFSQTHSLYLQNRINFQDRLTATQGMRVDNHSVSGTHITYKLDGAYLFPTGTKIRGGWATGWKAPTLYQLNALAIPAQWGWGGFGGGNGNLQPETSNSYELGMDQYMLGEKVIANLTYFNTMLHSVIGTTMDNMWNVSQYQNLYKAHIHGVECGGKFKPTEYFTLKGSYTYDFTHD